MMSNPIKSLPEVVLFKNLTKFSFLGINYSIYHLKIMDVFGSQILVGSTGLADWELMCAEPTCLYYPTFLFLSFREDGWGGATLHLARTEWHLHAKCSVLWLPCFLPRLLNSGGGGGSETTAP